MVNRYDTPVQAEFMNTYVPIPFEQLYTLGKQAKENVDQALKDYSTALDKWAEFQSPSEIDTKAYYDETYGRALPVAEEMSKNLDMIKTAEGRSKIYSAINNVDRAKLSKLRQSAEGLKERQKVNQRLMLEGKYNPLWHDVDFGGYNTLDKGIYNDVAPLAYQSIKDLTDKYVNNLKDSYIKKENGYLHTGVTGDQIKQILDQNRSGILSTPEAQMHMRTYIQQHPNATTEDAASAFMEKAYTDNQEYIRENIAADPFALEALRQDNANLRAGMKKGKFSQSGVPASVYDMFLADAQNNDKRLINSEALPRVSQQQNFANMLGEKRERALQELDVYKDALSKGQITQKQYDRAVSEYTKEFELSSKSVAESLQNAYRDDVRELFSKSVALVPSETSQKNAPVDYYNGANRTLDILMQPASSNDLSIYNTFKYGNTVKVNYNDIPTDAYVSGTSSGFKLSTDFVNKLMGVKTNPLYIKDNNNKERDFAKDLQNGVIKRVLVVPANTYSSLKDRNTGGVPKMAQRMTMLVPKSSLVAAGYDDDEIDTFFEKKLGIKGTRNINVNAISTNTIDNAFGTETSGFWTTKYDRVPNTGTDVYYPIDVTAEINPNDVNRVNWDTVRDKNRAGTTLAKDTYVLRQSDTYSTDY